MTTVKELVSLLKQFSLKDKVLMASDEEGNSFGNMSLHVAYDEDNKAIIFYPEETEDYEDLF